MVIGTLIVLLFLGSTLAVVIPTLPSTADAVVVIVIAVLVVGLYILIRSRGGWWGGWGGGDRMG
jgi:hypothetical protein